MEKGFLPKENGFSFIEVFISLSLLTAMVLVLLKQEWRVTQRVHRVVLRDLHFVQEENRHEVQLATLFSKQAGMSLTEVLIAVFIASFICFALVENYLSIKQHYSSLQNQFSQQLDRQLLTAMLRKSLREAGFSPCMGIDYLKIFDPRHPEAPPRGFEWSKSYLKLQGMSPVFSSVAAIIDSNHLQLTDELQIPAQQWLLLADCYHAELVSVVVQQGALLQLKEPLHYTYQAPLYLGRWREESYYIQGQDANHRRLFYAKEHAEELSSEVKDFSIELKTQAKAQFLHLVLTLTTGQLLRLESFLRHA